MAILRYNKIKDVTKNVNNAIGPTTSSTLRTVTTHNDTNSVYVATNGTPGGVGTAADPVDTLDAAIALLGGAKVIITVIRNGATGTLEFDSNTSTIPASTTIQVELGEVATIKRDYALLKDSSSGVKDWTRIMIYEPVTGTNKIIALNDDDERAYYSSTITTYAVATGGNTHSNRNDITHLGDRIVIVSTNGIDYSDNGTTYTTATGTAINCYCVDVNSSGLWIVGRSGTAKKSVDGATFEDHLTAPVDMTAIKVDSSGRWLAGDTNGKVYKSFDGYNWEQVYDILGEVRDIATDDDNNWIVAGRDTYIYYTNDMDNYLQSNSINTEWRGLKYFEGLWVACDIDTGGEIWYSNDRVDWIQLTTGAGTYQDVDFSHQFGYNIAKTADNVNYSTFSVFEYENDNTTLNGFYIDTQETLPNGIFTISNIGGAPDIFTLKWCEVLSASQYGSHTNQADIIENNIVSGARYNFHIFSLYSNQMQNNLSYDAELYGLWHHQANADILHNTFHNCKFGIYIYRTAVFDLNIKDNIIDDSVYALYINQDSTGTTTITNNIFNGSVTETLDSTNFQNVNALFVDEENEDFNIRHLLEGYPVESPAVEAASDSKDIGAYDVDFTINSIDFEEVNFNGQAYQIKREMIPVKPESQYTFSGGFKRNLLLYLIRYMIETKDTSATDLLYHVWAIKAYNEVIQLFPLGYNKFDSTVNGAFVWTDKADQDGVVELTMNSTDLAAISTFFNGERPEGWTVFVESISGASTPFDVYPFKIIQYLEGNKLRLENIYTKYPGSGFAANPDGNYAYHIIKSIFSGISKYTGTTTDGYYTLELTDILQGFELNEHTNYYLHIDYTDSLGSRDYFKIQSNTDDTILLEDVFSNSGSLVLNDYYHFSIDLYFVVSQPDETTSEVDGNVSNGKEHGKHGNDYHSTKFTREVDKNETGRLHYNEKNYTLTLEGTTETEEDGL